MSTEATPSTNSEPTPTSTATDATPPATGTQPAGTQPAGTEPASTEQPTLLNSVPAAGTEAQPPADGTQPPADGKENDDAAPAVPETYELQAPEGFEIRPEAIDLATPVFKELGLTNDQANKLMPVAAQFAQQIQQQLVDAHTANVAQWGQEAMADPEIGGGSPEAFQQNLGIAAKALDDLAGPEFREFLQESGLGNHPAMIRFALRAGKAISDESRIFRTDSAATPGKPDRLALLYPDDLPKN